jgi:transposase-like protein
LRIPQARDYLDETGRPFYPQSLERGVRSERAMTLAVAEMDVQGVSTWKVTAVVQELCGRDSTSTHVSRAAAELDEQLGVWRNRPIGEITDLILDAHYEKVRHDEAIVPCALLAAIGIGSDGKRGILGCSAQLSEAEPRWRSFLMRAEIASDLRRVFDADEPAAADSGTGAGSCPRVRSPGWGGRPSFSSPWRSRSSGTRGTRRA